MANPNRIAGVQRIIAVASGKGGVGKSTVSVNLACALTRLGGRVGLLDCDIYGPSIPLMMDCHERPTISPQEQLVPPVRHGVKLMSIGFLIEGDQPVIWRGPMITKTIQQFLFQVAWAELDYLLVDLPPGTGDAQLSLCQAVPLTVSCPCVARVSPARSGRSRCAQSRTHWRSSVNTIATCPSVVANAPMGPARKSVLPDRGGRPASS